MQYSSVIVIMVLLAGQVTDAFAENPAIDVPQASTQVRRDAASQAQAGKSIPIENGVDGMGRQDTQAPVLNQPITEMGRLNALKQNAPVAADATVTNPEPTSDDNAADKKDASKDKDKTPSVAEKKGEKKDKDNLKDIKIKGNTTKDKDNLPE